MLGKGFGSPSCTNRVIAKYGLKLLGKTKKDIQPIKVVNFKTFLVFSTK